LSSNKADYFLQAKEDQPALLRDAARLESGQGTGNGQAEGACKILVGRRPKQTVARRRVCRVNRRAGLCSLMFSHQWTTYWQSAQKTPPAEIRVGTQSERGPGFLLPLVTTPPRIQAR
jgi:hypothetical protein